ERLGLRTIGDLAPHPDLSAAFSSGFLEREDGWPGLKRHYGLDLSRVSVMEHALTYRALAAAQVDVMDVFSTDGQLERLKLRLLEDDRRFFPDYSAVLLARREMTERYPRTWARLREVLEGRLDAARMARLNAMADLDGRRVSEVAAVFLGRAVPAGTGRGREILAELGSLTMDHLVLVLVAVGVAIVLGIGKGPALVALSLYALLPIARNTYAGLIAIDRTLLEIAGVLRLAPLRRLLRIELPLAAISIMAGIKTAAV